MSFTVPEYVRAFAKAWWESAPSFEVVSIPVPYTKVLTASWEPGTGAAAARALAREIKRLRWVELSAPPLGHQAVAGSAFIGPVRLLWMYDAVKGTIIGRADVLGKRRSKKAV